MAENASDIPAYWQYLANIVGFVMAGAVMWYGRMKGERKERPEEEVNEDYILGTASLLDSRPIRREIEMRLLPITTGVDRLADNAGRSATALEGILQEMAERSEEDRENARLAEAEERGRQRERDDRADKARRRRPARKPSVTKT